MSEERISGLADAIAAALVAGDAERYRSLVESMPEDDVAASARPVLDALTKLMMERQEDLLKALQAARSDYDRVESVIGSMSVDDRDLVLVLAVVRAALLQEQVLLDLDLEIEMLDLPGRGGPFLFQTDDELLRVVKACMFRAFTELPYTWEPGQEAPTVRPIDGDAEAAEFRLDALLAEAERCAEAQLLNRRLTAVVLYTRWTPRFGRKTHATVIPSDAPRGAYSFGGQPCEALCGRGRGHVPPVQRILDEVDCPGCRNALALGGFLRPEQDLPI
jgi:hypothetical protein